MKYFAYGSNMDPARMSERNVNFLSRKHAILKNHSLQFNKVATANPKEGKGNIVPDEKDFVEGALYDIKQSDEKKLDRYEVYPDDYDKIPVRVKLDNGIEIDSFTYIAQPNKISNGLKPTKEYLSHYLAAKDILSKRYYKKLKSWPTLD